MRIGEKQGKSAGRVQIKKNGITRAGRSALLWLEYCGTMNLFISSLYSARKTG